jgi:hypothetical protein
MKTRGSMALGLALALFLIFATVHGAVAEEPITVGLSLSPTGPL